MEGVQLLDENDARYYFLANEGPVFYFRTDLEAPCFRVIAIDTREPQREHWTEIVPEVAKSPLQSASITGGRLFCEYLRDAQTEVSCYDLQGELCDKVELPGIGTASGFHGRRESTETFYSYTSFTEPSAFYRLDIATGKSHLWRQPDVAFAGGDYSTKQVFYRSKDGTSIPMFLVHKKDLVPDGSHPVLLYGYGGFHINLTPAFAVSRAVWLEMGGVFALPNLRGGGEYGRDWH